MKAAESDDEIVMVSIRMRADLRKKARIEAAKNEISLQELVARSLKFWMKEHRAKA